MISACSLLAGSIASNRVVVFLSDGEGYDDALSVLPCDPPVRFETFAVGAHSDCEKGSAGSRLGVISAATGGACTNVTNVDDLPQLLPAVIGSRITSATVSIDGGPEIDISGQLTPVLPISGPDSAEFDYKLPSNIDGSVEVCLTLNAEDAGGSGELINCTIISTGDAPLSFLWRQIESSGPPIYLSSSTVEQPSFLALDDGVYEFELLVTNNFGLTATDNVVVYVTNSVPSLSVEYSDGAAKGVTLFSASFTDEGFVDTHTGTIDWGDGTVSEIPVNVNGPGWGSFFGTHIYESSGTYPVIVTLSDDDGGSTSEKFEYFTVASAVAVWANSSTAPTTLQWTGNLGNVEGRVHSNNELMITGNSKSFEGPTNYAQTISGNIEDHDFSEDPSIAPIEDFPVTFDLNDYLPGERVSVLVGEQYRDMSAYCIDGLWKESQSILSPGVYYADCDIKLSGSNIGGSVTLAASGNIHISGARPAFDPYFDGLLFLSGSADDEAIVLSTESSKYLGVIYSQDGRINITGGSNRFFCGILGDRVTITGSDTQIRGADCATPALSSIVNPFLVPDLQLSLSADKSEVLPAQTIEYNLELTNDGARLILPGPLGLENVDTMAAEVQAFSYALEYFDIASNQWITLASQAIKLTGYTPHMPLPIVGGLELEVQPNFTDGVVFGTGPYSILETKIQPKSIATWGSQAVVDFDSEAVELLLDASRTNAVRGNIRFDLDPAGVQVRRFYSLGANFIDELRLLSGSAINAEITLIQPSGDAVLFSGLTSLSNLQQGDQSVLVSTYVNPALATRGSGEDSDQYASRLTNADGARLYAGGYARATGGVGQLFAPAEPQVVSQIVPIVSLNVSSPVDVFPGNAIDYQYAANNIGSASAHNVSLSTRIDGDNYDVTPPIPASLQSGEVANAALTFDVDLNRSAGSLINRNLFSWTDIHGKAYGPVNIDSVITVKAPPELVATLHDTLALDVDSNGLVSPGDQIEYKAEIVNSGGIALSEVVINLPLDGNSNLVPGSAIVDEGDITVNAGGIHVTIGALEPNASRTITARVEVVSPLPDNITQIKVQGTAKSAELDDVLTDDPAIAGLDNPTVTNVVIPNPAIYSTLRYEHVLDVGGDGYPSAGDTLRFIAIVSNFGTAPASNVIASFDIPTGATLKLGSTKSESGLGATINEQDGYVDITIPVLFPSTDSEITFELDIDQPLPIGTEMIVLQGLIEANDVEPTLTDNPGTQQELDPTVVMLSLDGEEPNTGDGVPASGEESFTGGNGLPAPTATDLSIVDGTVVASELDVTATLVAPEGEMLTRWTVYYRPMGSIDLIELESGTSADVQATIDPTLLANGIYGVVIESESSNGGISRIETFVSVESDFKPGRFSITYDDVSGIFYSMPITVKRTYDTLDAGITGEFGKGWSLSTADIQIQTNGLLGDGGWRQEVEQQTLLGAIYNFVSDKEHFVAVTWPNGNVDIFDLVPTSTISWFSFHTSAEFVARPGSTSTLRVADGSGSIYFANDGNLYDYLVRHQPYNPQRFIITDSAGTEYLVDKRTGIQQIKNASGNTITIDSNGIHNANGQSIVYIRDAEDRITKIVDLSGNTVQYEYDDTGNLTRVVDQVGEPTEYSYLSNPAHYLADITDSLGRKALRTEYDENGRAIATIDALGHRTEFDFDPLALSYSITDKRGFSTQYQFDLSGNLIQMVDPEGGTTSYSYDDANNPYLVTQVIDPNENSIKYAYDSQGNEISTSWDNNSSSTTVFDEKSRLTKSIHLSGSERLFSYDSTGNPAVYTNERKFNTAFTHDEYGRIASITDPEGYTTSLSYDDARRTVVVTNGDGTQRTHFQNSDGYVTRVVDESGASGQAVYDAKNRLIGLADRRGNQTDIVYVGKNISQIDYPNGSSYTFQYDDNDRLILETDPLGVSSFYSYDQNGNVISISDAAGNTTNYSYDGNNRIVQEIGPGGSIRKYEYDGNGNVIKATDRNGRSIVYEYNRVNKVVSEKWYSVSGQLVSEIVTDFDSADRIVAMRGPGTDLEFSYDEANYLSQVVDHNAPGGSFEINYSYDSRQNLIQVVDATGVSVASTYDPVGQRDQLLWNAAPDNTLQIDISRDASGKITEMQRTLLGTGRVSSSFSNYDANGMLSFLEHRDATGLSVEDIGYSYDSNRLVTQETTGTDQIDYHYDLNFQQLIVDDSRYSAPQVFSYDDSGNHTNEQQVIGYSNQLLSDQMFDYSYDNEGNLVERTDRRNGHVRTYLYDHRNRMVSAYELDETGILLFAEQYQYDGLGRRVRVTTDPDGDGPQSSDWVYHIYDGDNVWVDIDSGGYTDRYLFDEGVDRIVASYNSIQGHKFYLTDKQGSVRSILDAGFDVVDRLEFDAFGNFILLPGTDVPDTRYAFQGREYDKTTGLYYYRARYYDPVARRFVSQDPLKFDSGDFNFYRFVNNSAANWIDPFGLKPVSSYAVAAKEILTEAGLMALDCIGLQSNTGVAQMTFYVLWATNPKRGLTGFYDPPHQ